MRLLTASEKIAVLKVLDDKLDELALDDSDEELYEKLRDASEIIRQQETL